MLAGLLLLPLLELAVAIELGRLVGPLPVLGALLLGAVIGAVVVRRQGAAAWRSLNSSLQAGRPPSHELATAATLVLAGALLIVPGFLTDVVAVLLILPPTRRLIRRPLDRMLARAAAERVTVFAGFPGGGRFAGTGDDVVQGEIIEDDET